MFLWITPPLKHEWRFIHLLFTPRKQLYVKIKLLDLLLKLISRYKIYPAAARTKYTKSGPPIFRTVIFIAETFHYVVTIHMMVIYLIRTKAKLTTSFDMLVTRYDKMHWWIGDRVNSSSSCKNGTFWSNHRPVWWRVHCWILVSIKLLHWVLSCAVLIQCF